MTDPIVCIECKAVSYNDPGKTPIVCPACVKAKKIKLIEDIIEYTRESTGSCAHITESNLGTWIDVHNGFIIYLNHLIDELKDKK